MPDEILWTRWDEVDRLFSAALDQPEDDRYAFLERACADDPAMHEAVVSLLRAADRSEGMFEGLRRAALRAALAAFLKDR